MITKFGSLFAGHVDLDDIGFDATPVNDRWLSDERLAGVFDKTEAIPPLFSVPPCLVAFQNPPPPP